MRHSQFFLACLALLTAGRSYAQTAADATVWPQCADPESLPLFQPLSAETGTTDGATEISSERFDIGKVGESVFEGGVEMRRGAEWLGTDSLRYDHASGGYVTAGGVRFQNAGMRMTAETASGNDKAGTLEMAGLHYQFHAGNGNGSAAKVAVQGKDSLLSQADFSTCPANDKQWRFVADEIAIDEGSGKGTARNVRLQIGKVPLFWLPVMRFPTDSARASGVLAPRIGQDGLNGLDISLPIYLNLAPNYDATLIPRYFSERGFMLGSEFRYLFERNQGEFNATYLPSDDIRGGDRYLMSWRHFTAMSSAWHFRSELNRASDEFYFSDFGETIRETSTALLQSQAGFYGRGKYWNLELSASNWEIANPTQVPGSEPYRRLPRLALHGSRPLRPWLEAGLNAEAVAFQHDQLQDGRRLDMSPFVKFPIKGAFWYATPSFSWRQTEYWIDGNPADPGADTRLSRGMGIVSLDAGAYFERPVALADADYIQTLEPRLFYLNVPYRDQSAIPAFDTQPLTFMWPSLFRENRYGGADRQADADQLTLAVTSRFMSNETGKERMNVSLGRITYFETPRVYLPGEAPLPADGSAWVAEANIRLSDEWQIGLTQHWNPADRSTELSSLRGYWSLPSGLQLNAGYRYRAGFAEQTDFAFVVPVGERWRVLGRWDYSLRDDRNLESLLGLEWRSCCLAFRVFGRKYIRSFDSRENVGVFLELELNGLGRIGSKPELFRDNGILAY